MRPTSRSVLSGAFVRLACSNLFAQFSEQAALAAAPLIAVLLLGASASDVGLLQTAQTLPFLLLSVPLGVVADRISRRQLMAGSEALRAIALFSVMLLIMMGVLTLPMLAVFGFLGAIGTVSYNVSAPALVSKLVEREQLASANRWLELARSTSFAAGPAIGGAVVGWMGAPTVYLLAVLLSLLAASLLFGIPEPPNRRHIRRHFLQELRAGARFVLMHQYLRPILVTAVFFNTAWFVLQAVFVPYAVQAIGLTAATVGTILGMYGCGMVAGAFIVSRLARHLSFGAMIAVGPVSALASAIMMLSTIPFPSAVLAGASFFLFGAGPIVWTITTTTLRQSVTPNIMLARVSALIMTATFGARPIGAGIGALVAARFGAEAALLTSAAGFAIQFAVLLASPVPRLRRLPEPA